MKYDDNIKNQYTTLWNTMVIKDSVKPIINSIINKIVANKDKCKFFPDFYVIEEQGEWVVFPWEKGNFPEYPK